MAGIEDLTNMMMTGTRTDVHHVQGHRNGGYLSN